MYGSICVAKFNLKCNMQNGNEICQTEMYLNLHFTIHMSKIYSKIKIQLYNLNLKICYRSRAVGKTVSSNLSSK